MSVASFFKSGLGHRKLRSKLLLSILLLCALSLVGATSLSVAVLKAQLTESMDSKLITSAGYANTNTISDRSLAEVYDSSAPALSPPYAIIKLEDGTVVDSIKSNDASSSAIALTGLLLRGEFSVDQVQSVDLPDGEWRIYTQKTDSGVMVTGSSAKATSDITNQLFRFNGIIILSTLLILTFLASVMLTRNLRPLNELEAEARKVTAGDLSVRVPQMHPSTEVGALAEALNSMLEKLESAFSELEASRTEALDNEARTRQFTNDMSHELRTPLTSIRGFAQLGALDHPEDHSYAKINEEAIRMSALVDDLMMLAKLERTQNRPSEAFDLVAAALDVADSLAPSDERKVDVEFTSGVPVVLDPEAFRQILTNLVVNALHYTSGDVKVVLDQTETLAIVKVIDQGPGLSAEDAEKVFERFYRVETSRSRNTGGSGLGLSIVKSLIGDLGGDLTLETSPDTGSVFTITFSKA